MTCKCSHGPCCKGCCRSVRRPEDFGTNADGSKNKEYCSKCLQKGQLIAKNPAPAPEEKK